MQLNNKCCNLVFSCMQENFENLKGQFEKEKLRFSKIQSAYEVSISESSSKIKQVEAENKLLLNEMTVMKMNLEWSIKRNQMLKKKLKNQENVVSIAVNDAVKCTIEKFKMHGEIVASEMDRASRLNEDLKSEIETLKIKLQYFQFEAKAREETKFRLNFQCPKSTEISSDDVSSEASSMADFQWKLNSLTGDSNSSFHPESFVDGIQRFASKEFSSADSEIGNLKSFQTFDAVWMESQIEKLENQIQYLLTDSRLVKNELVQAKETIALLTKDLCSFIFKNPLPKI